jgi:catechol 2,3-dioxygenase-like lactoylglutathione lyase family enzyme
VGKEVGVRLQEGERMSLSRYKVCPGDKLMFVSVDASVAVSDLDRARGFYEGKLGFSEVLDLSDSSLLYACGGGTSLHVYAAPTLAGKTRRILATWYVADLEKVVDELLANGVVFEHHSDATLETNEKGIHELADGRVAWFKDPDGNLLAIEQ